MPVSGSLSCWSAAYDLKGNKLTVTSFRRTPTNQAGCRREQVAKVHLLVICTDTFPQPHSVHFDGFFPIVTRIRSRRAFDLSV